MGAPGPARRTVVRMKRPAPIPPEAGQESVWDYPRPPRLVSDPREVVVRWGTVEVARTRRSIRVLETAHPPSFYLPWRDVARHLFHEAPGSSFCEWKGPARYWSLIDAGRTRQHQKIATRGLVHGLSLHDEGLRSVDRCAQGAHAATDADKEHRGGQQEPPQDG